MDEQPEKLPTQEEINKEREAKLARLKEVEAREVELLAKKAKAEKILGERGYPSPEEVVSAIPEEKKEENQEQEMTNADRIREYFKLAEEQGGEWESLSQKRKPEPEAETMVRVRRPIEINLKPGAGKIPPAERTTEKEVEQEIKELPKTEREKLGFGLNRIGLSVEQKKNEFFAGLFGWIAKTNLEKNKTTSRFTKELADSFERDAEAAYKKAKAVKEGKETRKVENTGRLIGNIARYGRMLTDLTGASLASPLRYVMMAGMAFARGSQAAKETRLKNEEVIEKTRIADVKQAADEAWRIYERAQLKFKSDNVPAEALKNAYLMELPKDLQKRLENPSIANGMIQGVIKKDLKSTINKLNKSVEKIEKNQKLSKDKKEAEKEKLLKKWEKSLVDYDRIVTQYGTVDELAMAGRYAETLGKTVVAAVTIETIVLSIEKLAENLSYLFGSGAHEAVPPVVHDSIPEGLRPDPSGIGVMRAPSADELHNLKDFPLEKFKADAIIDAQHTAPTIFPDHALPTLDHDVIIGKGEGIEHALRRQIEHNPEMFGFKGDVKDLHAFAGAEAHRQALAHGYVDANGEVWVKEPGVAYQFQEGADGKINILEFGKNGKLIETHEPGSVFENSGARESYEYGHGNVPVETTPTINTEDAVRARLLEQLNLDQQTPRVVNTESYLDNHSQTSGAKTLSPEEVLNNKPEAEHGMSVRGETPGKVTPYNSPNPLEAQNPGGRATYEPYRPPYGEMGNQFNMPAEMLHRQIEQISITNIHNIFPDNTEQVWGALSPEPAETIMGMNNIKVENVGISRLASYLHKLQEVTGLEPKGKILFLRGPESTGDYIQRALKRAAEIGALDKVRP